MKCLALALAALLTVVPIGVQASGATFVAASATPNASFASAADFNTVAVTLADPGTPLHGSVTLSATASSTRAIASVRFQTAAAGSGLWSDLCIDTSAPYSCSFDSSSVADGPRDVRALATDSGGYVRSATVASRRFDNTAPAITVVDRGDAVSGTVTLDSTVSDGAGTGVASVRYQFRPASTGLWIDGCTATAAPYACTGDTTLVPDGVYELRAIATDAIGLATTSATVSGRVDNTPPVTASVTDPGVNLAGSVTLAGVASDTGSGIASLRFETAPAGSSKWTAACTDTSAPYSCSWSTTGVADGLYDLRAVATDGAGNTLASGVVANRRVDNNGPTVALADPGSPLHGSVNLSATATDPAGVASVTIERRAQGASGWSPICFGAASSPSCAWNTFAVGDGRYDLRASATDRLGHTSSSPIVTSRQVDNAAPTGTDVQVANGGAAHKLDVGDTLTFSWSEEMAPGSILSGWNGAQTAVTVHVANAGTSDTLSVWNAADDARLKITGYGTDLKLQADRTTAGSTFSATAVQSGAQVLITIGALTSGSSLSSTKTAALLWTPSARATDLAGKACATTAVSETSPWGKDF